MYQYKALDLKHVIDNTIHGVSDILLKLNLQSTFIDRLQLLCSRYPSSPSIYYSNITILALIRCYNGVEFSKYTKSIKKPSTVTREESDSLDGDRE